MRENQTTEFKRIQFLGNPFRAGQKPFVKKSDKKIPEGIVKCDKCGEYKGKVKKKDLNWNSLISEEAGEEYVTASCICDGILCPKCKKNKIRRPGSNEYDVEENEIWHSPILPCTRVCDECRASKEVVKEKKLVAMISTSGKSKEQIKAEAIKAWRNYQQKKAEAEAKLKSELKKD